MNLMRIEGPVKKKKKETMLKACLKVFLVALADILIIELLNHKIFLNGIDGMWQFIKESPLALLLNFLIILVTMVPTLFFKRRLWYCTFASIVWLAAGIANGFIRANRMTPFTTADLTVLNTGLAVIPNYLSKFEMVLVALLILLLIAGLVYLFIRGPKSKIDIVVRIIVGFVVLTVSCGMCFSVGKWAYNKGQVSDTFPNLAIAYDNYGFGFCFLETWLRKGISEPANYSYKEMEAILTETAAKKEEVQSEKAQRIKEIEKSLSKSKSKNKSKLRSITEQTDNVNVIFVQMESFMDPSELRNLELSEDAVPTWTMLKSKYPHGYLEVPVVGAGTANTECEVLTGMSTRYFGPGEYPYKTCLMDTTVESVPYLLKAKDYTAHAIHNHRTAFYSRNQVYANLGFDDFTGLEYMPKTEVTENNWCKDYVLTSQIENALDSTEESKDFIFTVTVQDHGSYPEEKVIEDPDIEVVDYDDTEKWYAVEYYVNQLHETDMFINDLLTMLEERGEKCLVVFYGDHLPSLELTEEDMQSGDIFKTEYLIWSNWHMTMANEDIYAYQLSSKVLEKLDVTEGAINSLHQFMKEDKSYNADLKRIQYDILYGNNYVNGGINPYEPTELKMGVADIEVESINEVDGRWMIYGKNFTPYCEVTVNGDIVRTDYESSNMLVTEQYPGTENPDEMSISVVAKNREILSVDE